MYISFRSPCSIASSVELEASKQFMKPNLCNMGTYLSWTRLSVPSFSCVTRRSRHHQKRTDAAISTNLMSHGYVTVTVITAKTSLLLRQFPAFDQRPVSCAEKLRPIDILCLPPWRFVKLKISKFSISVNYKAPNSLFSVILFQYLLLWILL
jgi:hypothetical protein